MSETPLAHTYAGSSSPEDRTKTLFVIAIQSNRRLPSIRSARIFRSIPYVPYFLHPISFAPIVRTMQVRATLVGTLLASILPLSNHSFYLCGAPRNYQRRDSQYRNHENHTQNNKNCNHTNTSSKNDIRFPSKIYLLAFSPYIRQSVLSIVTPPGMWYFSKNSSSLMVCASP